MAPNPPLFLSWSKHACWPSLPHPPQKRHWLPKRISSHRRFGGSWESSFPVIAKTAVAFQRLFRALPDWQRLSIDFPGHRQNGSRGPNPFSVIAGMAGASEAFFRFWGSLGRFSRCRRWSWGSPQRPRRSAETENGRTEGFQGPLGLIAGLAGLWELNFRHPPKWQALSMLLPK